MIRRDLFQSIRFERGSNRSIQSLKGQRTHRVLHGYNHPISRQTLQRMPLGLFGASSTQRHKRLQVRARRHLSSLK